MLVKISKVIATLLALGLIGYTLMLSFVFFAFMGLDPVLIGLTLLYLLVSGLTLRSVFSRRTNHVVTGLEFIVYGLLLTLGWFKLDVIALYPAGLFILCGLLALLGASFPEKPKTPTFNGYQYNR